MVKEPSGRGFWVEKRQDKAKKEEEVRIEEGPRVGRTGPPMSGGSKGQGVNAHQATSPYNFRFRWEPPPCGGGRRWCRRVGEEARWIAQGLGTRPLQDGPSSVPIQKQDEDVERGPERGPSAATSSSIVPEPLPERGQFSAPSEFPETVPEQGQVSDPSEPPTSPSRTDLDEAEGYQVVEEVLAGSLAEKAGLRVGDRVWAINQRKERREINLVLAETYREHHQGQPVFMWVESQVGFMRRDTDGRGRQRDATGRRHEESGTWSTVDVEPIEITSDSRQSGRRTRRRTRSRGRQESEAEKKKTRVTEPTTRTWRVDVVRWGLGRGLVTRPLLASVVAAFPWARLVFQAPSGCIRSTDVDHGKVRPGFQAPFRRWK